MLRLGNLSRYSARLWIYLVLHCQTNIPKPLNLSIIAELQYLLIESWKIKSLLLILVFKSWGILHTYKSIPQREFYFSKLSLAPSSIPPSFYRYSLQNTHLVRILPTCLLPKLTHSLKRTCVAHASATEPIYTTPFCVYHEVTCLTLLYSYSLYIVFSINSLKESYCISGLLVSVSTTWGMQTILLYWESNEMSIKAPCIEPATQLSAQKSIVFLYKHTFQKP